MTDDSDDDNVIELTGSRRNPRRFTDDQIEAQQHLALRMWLGGVDWQRIAQQFSDDARYGWGEVSVSTVRRRVKAAVEGMAPHDEWAEYASRQLAEIAVAREKVNQAIFTWNPRGDVSQLASAITSLVRLHEREAKITGGDETFGGRAISALGAASMVEEIETRTSVQRIVMDPAAFAAAIAAFDEIENNILDAEIVAD